MSKGDGSSLTGKLTVTPNRSIITLSWVLDRESDLNQYRTLFRSESAAPQPGGVVPLSGKLCHHPLL